MADFLYHHDHQNHDNHHHEEHLESSETLKDIVIGMSDGLTVPFALAAGLSGAVDNNAIILTAGIAEIAAGAIAMGLGGYLSGQTEVHHYDAELKREYWEIEHKRDWEIKEVKDIFLEMGLSEKGGRRSNPRTHFGQGQMGRIYDET